MATTTTPKKNTNPDKVTDTYPVEPKTPEPDTAATGIKSADTQSGILQAPSQKPPTEQQGIDKILQPYVNQLMQLGPEYQKEMDYLAPYLTGSVTDNQLSPAPTYTGPDANAVNAGQSSLSQADNALGEAVLAEPKPGFGSLAPAAKEYESTLEPSAGIQSALAYQKYLETYGGLQQPSADWTQEQKDAYAAIIGSTGGSTSGLPSITDETAASTASATANQVQEQLTNASTGSTSGGGNIQ